MKDLLKRLTSMENEMNSLDMAQEKALAAGDAEKAEFYENESDELYEKIYQMTEDVVKKIVRTTNGQINEQMARFMIQTKRTELEQIFA